MRNTGVRMSVLGACLVLTVQPLLGAAAAAQESFPLDGWVKAQASTRVPLDGWIGSPHGSSGSRQKTASTPLDAWAVAETTGSVALDGWASAIATGENGPQVAVDGTQLSPPVSSSSGFQLEYAVALITSVLIAGVGIFALRMRFASPQH